MAHTIDVSGDLSFDVLVGGQVVSTYSFSDGEWTLTPLVGITMVPAAESNAIIADILERVRRVDDFLGLDTPPRGVHKVVMTEDPATPHLTEWKLRLPGLPGPDLVMNVTTDRAAGTVTYQPRPQLVLDRWRFKVFLHVARCALPGGDPLYSPWERRVF